MAERKGWLGVAVLVILAGLCGEIAAEAGPRIVLHIDDRAGVPAHELGAAKAVVEQIFAAAEVEIVWAEGRFPVSITRPSGERGVARQLAVMLVNADPPAELPTGCTLGFAARGHSLAYAFYNRIADVARTSAGDVAMVLGRVIAHEVGHLLLPGTSHSSSGIMRAELDLGLSNPDRFTDSQAISLRVAILNRSSNK